MKTRALLRAVPASLARACLTHIERQPIDVETARREHAAYAQALEEQGIACSILPAADEQPDSAFVEDTAIVLPELAILCRPALESRRKEVVSIASLLAHQFPIARLREPATLEGGDVLRVEKTLFVGASTRSNAAGHEALAELVEPHGYQVRPVSLSGALHLKTVATEIEPGRLLIDERAVDSEAFGGLDCVATSAQDPRGANTLRCGSRLLCSRAHPFTNQSLRAIGLDVCELDIRSFERAEAGLTCLSICWEEH